MAVPSNEHERTLAFAEIALQQIRVLRLPASPRNFEIWYQYATGTVRISTAPSTIRWRKKARSTNPTSSGFTIRTYRLVASRIGSTASVRAWPPRSRKCSPRSTRRGLGDELFGKSRGRE
jgi:hypothetical protein